MTIKKRAVHREIALQCFYTAILTLAALNFGCAGIDHKPLPAEKDVVGKNVGGIPYYEPAIYFLAYSDGNGNIKVERKVMPDQTRKMVAQPINFWSNVKTTMKFAGGKGMLTEQDSTIDASEVVEAGMEVLKEAAKTAASLVALEEMSTGQVPAPKLFKLVCEDDGRFVLYGSAKIAPIEVTLAKN